MKNILRKNEFYVALMIIGLVVLIQLKSGQFFTPNNLVDLARSCIIPCILTVGVMIQLVASSIDVSFPAIAMLSMYVVTNLATKHQYTGPVIFLFLFAAIIGFLLGSLNGILAAWLKLPTLIITLATSSIFMGILQGVLRCRVIAVMAEPLEELGKSYLYVGINEKTGLTSPLPTLFLLMVFVVLFVCLFMNYSVLGRSIFAFGGDQVSAQRIGVNTTFVQYFVFAFMGILSGIGGLTRTILTGSCQPTTLEGYEMLCIAAAVLGGTRLSGGVGSVSGAVLGVILLMLVNNNLILLGIPTYSSKFFTGIFIFLGISMSSYQALKRKSKLNAVSTL